jgi:hypothetical protein
MKILKWGVLLFLALFCLPTGLSYLIYQPPAKDWWSARNDASGLSPSPSVHTDAIVQVFVAEAFGWRGAFGVHSWVTLKAAGAADYSRLEVIGWGVGGGRPAIRISTRPPDAYWFGSKPRILLELRGSEAAAVIPKILAAVDSYPFPYEYRVWPGPNSNTFTAHIGRQVPELRLHLPAKAIGKDFLPLSRAISLSISGTGAQVSLYGLAGLTLGAVEGLELNILGLTVGAAFWPPSVSVPSWPRLAVMSTGRAAGQAVERSTNRRN